MRFYHLCYILPQYIQAVLPQPCTPKQAIVNEQHTKNCNKLTLTFGLYWNSFPVSFNSRACQLNKFLWQHKTWHLTSHLLNYRFCQCDKIASQSMSCISNSVRSLEGSPKLLSEAALCIIRGRIKLESHCLEAHKTQRSLGFMPRVWKSLFQNKNCCFAVLAPWQKPPVHDFWLIMEMDGSGDVFAWHAELRANQSRERSCSSTAQLAGPPSARTQQQQHTGSWTGCAGYN